MRQFKNPAAYAHHTGLSGGERKRLIGLSIALLMVVFGIGWAWLKSQEAGEIQIASTDDPINESVAIPELDTAGLEALIKDATAEERVLLDDDALDRMLSHVRRLTPRHYVTLGTSVLDSDLRGRMLDEPSSLRGKAVIARGWLKALDERRRAPTAPVEYAGRLLDDDGNVTYFVTDQRPERLLVDVDYVRIDGRFLGVFSEEDPEAPGTWVEAPLIVGNTLIQSRTPLPPVTSLDVAYISQEVEHDAIVVAENGLPGVATYQQPHDAIWHAMAWARDASASANWDDVPEVDFAQMKALSDTPDEFVGQLFQFPVCRLQGVRVRKAAENSARFDEYTEGWLGNNTWKNVAHFWSPIPDRELELSDYVRARGVYLRNFAYDSAKHGVRISPMFIVTDLESFEPESAPIYRNMAVGIAAASILLTLLFIGLVRRDRKRSKVAEEDLIRRRRARRATASTS